jgi:hypothetical protein
MKHTVQMGPVSMIHIPGFIRNGSDTQKLIGEIHRHTDSMEITSAYFCLFFFSK